jgi:hypothetical protein
MAKRAKKFRVGMRACSIYQPERVFVIDRSAIPARIFHEKGSNSWWTKKELQAIGAPENPLTSHRLNGTGEMRENAFQCVPEAEKTAPEASAGLGQRECPHCRVRFQPKRRWQKFHSEACRLRHWKQRRDGAANQGQATQGLATAVIQ